MENYIKAQQEIINRAAQISVRNVVVFIDGTMVLDSRNRTNGKKLSIELLEKYNIPIPEPEYVPTENPFLKGKVIGRPLITDEAEEYPVLVGNVRDYKTYAGVFAKETSEELRKISQEDVQVIWIPKQQGEANPTMVSCQYAEKPEQCPCLSDSSLSLISAKIPQSKEEMLAKLNELFEEAAYKEYDMDEIIDALKKKYDENAAINYDEYRLRFDYEHTIDGSNKFAKFDIYVKENDTPLKLQAIEKTTYLTYILYKDGVINDLTKSFMHTLAVIYSNMADVSERDVDFGGVMSSKLYNEKTKSFEFNNFISPDTVAGYRSAINKEINKHIKTKRLAQDFRIEGIKNQPFKVVKSTPELREEIKRLFHIE